MPRGTGEQEGGAQGEDYGYAHLPTNLSELPPLLGKVDLLLLIGNRIFRYFFKN